MAETGLSKSAKKNMKKRLKKHGGSGSGGRKSSESKEDLVDIRDALKEQLEVCKTNGDHVTAGKLREQVWVMNDYIAGVKTDIPEDYLAEIISGLPIGKKEEPATPASPPSATSGLCEPEKQIMRLQKKLAQIDTLKAKQAKGEKLETNQLDKIKTEDSLKEKVEKLEKIIEDVLHL